MKRTYEIDDTLQERVSSACDDVKNLAERWLDDNPDADEAPDLGDDLDYDGSFHEIVDGSVPIYTKEIEDTWYLHKNDLEQAYEDAGIGDNPLDNNGMAAIYFYIEQQVAEWYDNQKEDIFVDWVDAQLAAANAK